jgi:hypothetical protein
MYSYLKPYISLLKVVGCRFRLEAMTRHRGATKSFAGSFAAPGVERDECGMEIHPRIPGYGISNMMIFWVWKSL